MITIKHLEYTKRPFTGLSAPHQHLAITDTFYNAKTNFNLGLALRPRILPDPNTSKQPAN